MVTLSLWLLILPSFVLGTQYHYSISGPDDYDGAGQTCRSKGEGCDLPVYQTRSDILSVQNRMTENGLTHVWLPLVSRIKSSWAWLDSTPLGEGFQNQNWRDYMNCGVLHLRDKILEADTCSIRTYGYVCSGKGDKCLTAGVSNSACAVIRGRTYIRQCSSENWYNARNRCGQLGMDLVTGLDDSLITELSKLWHKSGQSRCKLVWIGFTRQHWLRDGHGSKKLENVKTTHYWGPGQPGQHRCSVVHRDAQKRFFWQSANCSHHHHYVCRCPTETRKHPVHDFQSGKKKSKPGNTQIVGICMGVIILVLIVFFGALFIKRRKKKLVTRDEESSGKPEHPTHRKESIVSSITSKSTEISSLSATSESKEETESTRPQKSPEVPIFTEVEEKRTSISTLEQPQTDFKMLPQSADAEGLVESPVSPTSEIISDPSKLLSDPSEIVSDPSEVLYDPSQNYKQSTNNLRGEIATEKKISQLSLCLIMRQWVHTHQQKPGWVSRLIPKKKRLPWQ